MNRRKNHAWRQKVPLVTLLTDFGLNDEYVGAMKGVILSKTPDASIVDISHLVPPQNIQAASHLLERTYPYFPAGTVHLAVVDPGVGSSRHILAVAADGQFFVGPDNGIFTPIFLRAASLAVHRITSSQLFLGKVGRTFHGRDIMAPIAAHLAAGLAIDEVGPRVAVRDCVHLRYVGVKKEGDVLRGEITYIDRFGNLCTSISRENVESFAADREIVVRIGNLTIPFCSSYADRGMGLLLALYDSHDRVEIALNQGNAARELDIAVGAPICLTLR